LEHTEGIGLLRQLTLLICCHGMHTLRATAAQKPPLRPTYYSTPSTSTFLKPNSITLAGSEPAPN